MTPWTGLDFRGKAGAESRQHGTNDHIVPKTRDPKLWDILKFALQECACVLEKTSEEAKVPES